MSRVTANEIRDHAPEDRGDPAYLGIVIPATGREVRMVLEADPESDDGRSEWVWLQLTNGDLILGVFPQGNTYFAAWEGDNDGTGPGGDASRWHWQEDQITGGTTE